MIRFSRYIRTGLIVSAVLVCPLLVFAESPPCICQVADYSITVGPALDCFRITKRASDACHGGDIEVSATNECAFDIVIEATRNLHGQLSDQTINAGQTSTWSEDITPDLTPGDAQLIAINRNLAANGQAHRISLRGNVECKTDRSQGKSDDGCCSTASGDANPNGLLSILVVVGGLVMRRRSQ